MWFCAFLCAAIVFWLFLQKRQQDICKIFTARRFILELDCYPAHLVLADMEWQHFRNFLTPLASVVLSDPRKYAHVAHPVLILQRDRFWCCNRSVALLFLWTSHGTVVCLMLHFPKSGFHRGNVSVCLDVFHSHQGLKLQLVKVSVDQ